MVLHQLIFYKEAWLKRKGSVFRFTFGIQIPFYENPPRPWGFPSHHKSYFRQDYELAVRNLCPLYFVKPNVPGGPVVRTHGCRLWDRTESDVTEVT